MQTSTLKILHVLDHSLPVQDGYAARSSSIFAAQRKRGWDPIAITSPKHYESWIGPYADVEEVDNSMYFHTIKSDSGTLPLIRECALMIALARRLRSVVKIEKPVVLHAHSPTLNALPALWVAHTARLPLVYELRSLWEDSANYGVRSWKYRLSRCVETFVCRVADHVIVISEGLRSELKSRGISTEKSR
jgi:hypothetical protein